MVIGVKYILQFAIIAGVCFAGELMHTLLPLPVPASIYGLLLLFSLLMLKVIKVEQIREISAFFLAVMPVLFLSPSVSLMTSFPLLKGKVLPLFAAAAVSTVITMLCTALVSQAVIRRKEKKKSGGRHE